jgi:hypothetical protein
MTNQNSSGSLPDGCKTIRSTDTVLAQFFWVWDNGKSII